MIKGKQCETCNGSGQVDVQNYEDGFHPPIMPCYKCGGMGNIAPQPENIQEVAVMLAEALDLATRAKISYRNKLSLYKKWRMGACRNEAGHRL